MKGGKSDKPRKSSVPKRSAAGAALGRGPARKTTVSPPKGSRKRPDSGGSSRKGMED